MSEGYVYVIQGGEEYKFKIGRAANLRQRVRALRTMSPIPIHVVGWFRSLDYERAEIYWHRHFGLARKHGEWFDLPFEALQEIARECHIFGRVYESRVPCPIDDLSRPYYVSLNVGEVSQWCIEDRDGDDPRIVVLRDGDGTLLKVHDDEIAIDPRGALLNPMDFGIQLTDGQRAAYALHCLVNQRS